MIGASRPAPPASSPAPAAKQEKQRQPPGGNPKRKYRPPLKEGEERFSSAPVYESPYKPEDYNPDGSLKVIRKVPLGDYPILQQELTDRTTQQDLAAPPNPIAPPKARSTMIEGQRAAAKAAGEVLLGAAAEKQEIDIADAPLVHQTLVEKGPAPKGGRVEMKPLPEPRMQVDDKKKYDADDPPEFLDLQRCHLFTLSWIANRHPQEAQIMEHRVQQLLAERQGKYNPLEDPPVNLDEIVPTVAIRVARTWSQQECEYRNGENVANYAKKLNAVTGVNVLNWPCGKGLVLPVSDMIRGQYSDPTQQQQMDAFYSRQKQSADDILDRIKKDKEVAEAAHEASLAAMESQKAAEQVEVEARSETLDSTVGLAVESPVLTSSTPLTTAETRSWASIAAAVSSLPTPVPTASAPVPPKPKPAPLNVEKRAGVRRAGPQKRK